MIAFVQDILGITNPSTIQTYILTITSSLLVLSCGQALIRYLTLPIEILTTFKKKHK